MNTNRLISRHVLAVMLITFFTLIWVPISHADVTAERVLPQSYYLQNQQNLMVKIKITGEADSVIITETIPTGWSIYRVLNDGVVNGNTISWELTAVSGSTKVTYYVNTPDAAESDAVFSGVINGDPIGGNNVMVFHQPTPGMQLPMSNSFYQYWLYLPSDYSDQEGQRPLILFLHGPCIVDLNLDEVLIYYDASPLIILENPDHAETYPELFQSIVVSPYSTTPAWDIQRLKDFLTELLSTYSIDPNRVYLIGHAIGGDAGWKFANSYPDVLAAFFSFQLNNIPSVSANLAGFPVWLYEFETQYFIPFESIEACVNDLASVGAQYVYTLIPKEIEPLRAYVFNNPELYRWLHQQNKQTRLSGIADWEMY
ncbi:MAG: hypothetical protein C4527_19945 [Candidatus Omnitrophota bacterium]|jgi:pimeloyl-ACP methyl ester carboxylesterase|nr:MAG: hypothetical protein C4527_19945 [Candidatus Omnitrophota bacterium]